MSESPNITVELPAHTDYRNSAKYNQTLSYNRAKTCVDYLINEKGIDPNRISPAGYGESQPAVLYQDITTPSGKIVPKGTTLLSHKKIKLSPKITGFTSEDIKSIIITNPNKFIIDTYPTINKQIVNKKITSKISTINPNDHTNTTESNNLQNNALPENSSGVIDLNDLSASVSGSRVRIPNFVYSLIGLIIIIGIGITAFLLIKKKDKYTSYLEKEIQAKDIKIIE